MVATYLKFNILRVFLSTNGCFVELVELHTSWLTDITNKINQSLVWHLIVIVLCLKCYVTGAYAMVHYLRDNKQECGEVG